jgi:hypothetical protein
VRNPGGCTEFNRHAIHESGGVPANSNKEIVVNVIYTDLAGTLAALQSAETLARQLRARIALLAAHAVPYSLPVTRPPIALEFASQRLLALARKRNLQTSIEIYICRDRTLCLLHALYSRSLVVLGAKKRWWPTRDAKLAMRLQSAGHQIVVVEPAA